MLFVHEKNIDTKIKEDYKKAGAKIIEFRDRHYYPMRDRMLALTFDSNDPQCFVQAAQCFDAYYKEVLAFSEKHKIDSRSKFASTFYEEISEYLFKDLPQIAGHVYGFYNKGIYAGLKIDTNQEISVITKDVDFCIGKKVDVKIGTQPTVPLILPIVAVEVKTYLDATMFGEIKSSSKAIRSAAPNSKTYVLMGYKVIKDEHIIAARQDSALTEMFALKAKEGAKIDPQVLRQYWEEVAQAVSQAASPTTVPASGRLLYP